MESENSVYSRNENAKSTRKDIKKSGMLYRMGNVSDKTVSVLASIVVGLVLIEPLIMFVFSLFINSIDVLLMTSYYIICTWIFPVASVLVFVIYLLIFLKIRNDNKGLLYHIKKNPLFIIFLFAVLFMLISQKYNVMNGWDYSIIETADPIRGESFDMQYLYFIVLLFAGSQIRYEKHKKILLRSQLFVSILVVASAFIHWKSTFPSFIFDDYEWLFNGFFTNANYYGYYLSVFTAMAGAMFVYEKKTIWKIIAIISFGTNTVALSLNNTMGAWLASALAIVFIIISHLILEKKINFFTLLLIPVFVACIYIPGHIEGTFEENMSEFGSDVTKVVTNAEDIESAGTERIMLWFRAINIIKDHKLFGLGFEGALVRRYGEAYLTRPHNEFLQYAMFYGIPMAVMYFTGCLGIFIRALKKKKYLDGATLCCLTATFGYLASSFFGLTVFSTAMFLFVFMGMAYVREGKDDITNTIIDDRENEMSKEQMDTELNSSKDELVPQ